MIRRLLLLFFLIPAAFSGANALTRVGGISDSQSLEYEAALIRQEGGCVFIIVEGYPPSRLEFADLNAVERKAASKPFKGMTNLEDYLDTLFNEIKFSSGSEVASGESVRWDNPRRLVSENFGYIFIPAVAAQLKKAEPGRKIQFYIGEESSVTMGSIFAGDNAIHLIVEKINGKPLQKKIAGKIMPLWKIVIKPPVKFYKQSSRKKTAETIRTWIYYPFAANN